MRGRGERRAWAQPAWARRPATGGEGVGVRVASASEAEPGRERGGPSSSTGEGGGIDVGLASAVEAVGGPSAGTGVATPRPSVLGGVLR